MNTAGGGGGGDDAVVFMRQGQRRRIEYVRLKRGQTPEFFAVSDRGRASNWPGEFEFFWPAGRSGKV